MPKVSISSPFYRKYKTFITKTILRLLIAPETVNTIKLINRVAKWFVNAADLFNLDPQVTYNNQPATWFTHVEDLFDSTSLTEESNVQVKNLETTICDDCIRGIITINWPFNDYFFPFAVSIWVTDYKEDDVIYWYILITPRKDSARAKDIAEIIKLWRLSRSSLNKELRDFILDVHPRIPTFILKYSTITVSSYLLCRLSKFIEDIQDEISLDSREFSDYYEYYFQHDIIKFKLAEKIRLDVRTLAIILSFMLGLIDSKRLASIHYAKVYHNIEPPEDQDERLSILFDFNCKYYA